MVTVAAARPETTCIILRPYTHMKMMLLAGPHVVHGNKKVSGSGKFRGKRSMVKGIVCSQLHNVPVLRVPKRDKSVYVQAASSIRRPPGLLPTKGPLEEWGPSDAAKSGVIHTYAGRKESRSGVHEANQRLPASVRPERGSKRSEKRGGGLQGGCIYAAVRCIELKETIAGCTNACLGRRACCRLA